MDYPRDGRELKRERRQRLLRTAGPSAGAILIIFALILLIRSGSDGRGDIPPLPPRSPLPDSIWTARIEEWAGAADPLNSLIIAHEDTILTEQYFRGMTANRQVNIKSASKSVMSALIGIALEQSHLDSVEQRISEFLPSYLNGGSDPRKKGITIGHLLSMSSGLEGTSFGNYDAWIASSDWIRYALDRPLLADPGSRMIYSTGNTHLLSVILTEASGVNTLSFSRRHLFQPLGIRSERLLHGRQQHASLTPGDVAVRTALPERRSIRREADPLRIVGEPHHDARHQPGIPRRRVWLRVVDEEDAGARCLVRLRVWRPVYLCYPVARPGGGDDLFPRGRPP